VTINAIGGRDTEKPIEGKIDDVVASSTLLVDNCVSVVVLNCHANRGRVDVAVAPGAKSPEARLGEKVEDAVEDGLRVGRYDVAAFAKTPSYRIKDPQERSHTATVQEVLADF
jgi:hypothetical protein